MTIHDVGHYTEAEKARIIASYPVHEREARSSGVPTMGKGKIFPIDQAEISVTPFAIPAHWPQLNAMDFGYDHPFGAVNSAYDRDADCFYICKTYRQRESTPIIHSAAIKPWGAWIPWAWPHDGFQHDKGSGSQLKELYVAQGLNMLPEHATHPSGGNGVEEGLIGMFDRMQTGRFKVFSTLSDWFEEFRLYHRKDLANGQVKIVKERDDLMSASRYAMMMNRFARTRPTGSLSLTPNLGFLS